MKPRLKLCIQNLNIWEKETGQHYRYCAYSHVGIISNEEANVPQKGRASTPFIGSTPFGGIGSDPIRRLLEEQEEEINGKHWME